MCVLTLIFTPFLITRLVLILIVPPILVWRRRRKRTVVDVEQVSRKPGSFPPQEPDGEKRHLKRTEVL